MIFSSSRRVIFLISLTTRKEVENLITSVRALQEEETNELFRRFVETKDSKSRDRLIILHQNLARYLAGKFANRGIPLEDLEQVGMIGLINAVDRFDPDRGLKFSTYATPTIVGEIRRHFRDKGWSFNIPRWLQDLNLAVIKATDKLAQKLERQPTILEIAGEVGADEAEIIEAIDLDQYFDTVPLDAKIGPSDKGEGTLAISEIVGENHKEIEDISEYGDLRGAMELLEARDRAVIQYRFFGNMTKVSVSSIMKVSQMQVSRIEARSIKALKNIIEFMKGGTSFAVIGASETRVAFSLWPHLSYTQGRSINRKKLAVDTGLVQGYLNRVITRLVELGVLIRMTDSRYKRGLAIVFFNGQRLPRASNGLKVLKYQFYNLDEVTTEVINFKPKNKKQVVVAPQVCRLILNISKSALVLNKRQTIVAMFLWPMLSEKNESSLNFDELAEEISLTSTELVDIVCQLEQKGILLTNKPGLYRRGRPAFIAHFSKNEQDSSKMLFSVNLTNGIRYNLNHNKPFLRCREKVGNIVGGVLPRLTATELDACLIIWPQLSTGDWAIPDYNKLSRILNIDYNQAYCVIRRVIRKGFFIKEKDKIQKAKTDFIYRKYGKASQICNVELVQYRQKYNLNELSQLVGLSA